MNKLTDNSHSQEWTAATTDAERAVVLAKFRADMDARKGDCAPIMAAWRRGDIQGCEDAQRAFRKRFS
jgi:hypothetical protein